VTRVLFSCRELLNSTISNTQIQCLYLFDKVYYDIVLEDGCGEGGNSCVKLSVLWGSCKPLICVFSDEETEGLGQREMERNRQSNRVTGERRDTQSNRSVLFYESQAQLIAGIILLVYSLLSSLCQWSD
jgi:hypothetical protein